MRRLYPGDVVHIRDDLRHANECNSGLLDSMKNMAGQWVTIQDYWGKNIGQHCYWIAEDNGRAVWSEDCFDFDMMQIEDDLTPDITELI